MIAPKDPIILLSLVNTKLRDFYPSLDEMCAAEGLEKDDIVKKLAGIGYIYSPQLNKFI